MSADPRLTLTESQAASNYASEDFQKLARKTAWTASSWYALPFWNFIPWIKPIRIMN